MHESPSSAGAVDNTQLIHDLTIDEPSQEDLVQVLSKTVDLQSQPQEPESIPEDEPLNAEAAAIMKKGDLGPSNNLEALQVYTYQLVMSKLIVDTSVLEAFDSKLCAQLGIDEILFRDAMKFALLNHKDHLTNVTVPIKGLKREVLKHQLVAAFWCIIHGRSECPGGAIGDDMGFGKVCLAFILLQCFDLARQHTNSTRLAAHTCEYISK